MSLDDFSSKMLKMRKINLLIENGMDIVATDSSISFEADDILEFNPLGNIRFDKTSTKPVDVSIHRSII